MSEAIAAPSEVRQFPCRQCGAALVFSSASQAMKCPYCGVENAPPTSSRTVEELDLLAQLQQASADQPQREAKTVKCQACAASSEWPAGVVADHCPFCGSAQVVPEGGTTGIRPGSLLPFAATAAQALAAFQAWVKSRWFAPNALKRAARADALKGVYLPYWTFDSQTTSDYRGERGDYYYVTQTYTVVVNGRSETRTRQVRHTRWTSVSGRVALAFDDVLVAATRSVPKPLLDELEPWDLPKLVPFGEAYLAGYVAESYRLTLSEGLSEARQKMNDAIASAIRSDIGGDEQRISSVATVHSQQTFKHILLPVWISSYRYHDKIYRYLVNARTLEVQGERPYSWIKITLAVLGGLAIAAAIFAAVQS